MAGSTAKALSDSILGDRAVATGMIFFIVLGAAVYNAFLALTQLPQVAAAWVVAQGFDPWLVLTVILLLYLVLGCVMDSLSMILLTDPDLLPDRHRRSISACRRSEFAIWFGILVLIVVEVGLITPPVGMNLFIINAMAKDTPMIARPTAACALRRQRPRPHRDPRDLSDHHLVSGAVALLSGMRRALA